MFHAARFREDLIAHLKIAERSHREMEAAGRADSAFLLTGGPVMVLDAEEFLFPQYDDSVKKFKRFSKEWLQDMARRLLKERRRKDVHP